MGSELCISDSALIKAEVEEKGNGGGADLRKRKIGTEVEEDVNEEEEENDDDDENESAYEKLNKEDFICEIEGEDEGTGEGTGEGTESDTDSHSDSDFVNEDDKKAYMKYSEEFRSSNGFDIENYYVRPPGGKFVLGFLSRMDPGSGLDKYCEKAVKNVLKFQNLKNNTNLQYVKIIKANVRGPGMYFVTFEAEDTISRTVKVYQSQVYRSPGSGNTTIFLFREKHG